MRGDVIFVTSYSVPDKLESNLSPRSSPFAKGEADCKAQRVTASQLSFFDAWPSRRSLGLNRPAYCAT